MICFLETNIFAAARKIAAQHNGVESSFEPASPHAGRSKPAFQGVREPAGAISRIRRVEEPSQCKEPKCKSDNCKIRNGRGRN